MFACWLSSPTTPASLRFGSAALSEGGLRLLPDTLAGAKSALRPYAGSGVDAGTFGMGGLRHFTGAAQNLDRPTTQSHTRKRTP